MQAEEAGVDGVGVPQRQASRPCKYSVGLDLYSGKGNKILFSFLLEPVDSASEVRTQG